MCRKNQLLGAVVAAFGTGLLIATCFDSMFLCGCIGAVLLGFGIVLFVKK